MSGSRSQPLPAKEDALFRQLVKLYESKHYKKAIKNADQVLPLTVSLSSILNGVDQFTKTSTVDKQMLPRSAAQSLRPLPCGTAFAHVGDKLQDTDSWSWLSFTLMSQMRREETFGGPDTCSATFLESHVLAGHLQVAKGTATKTRELL